MRRMKRNTEQEVEMVTSCGKDRKEHRIGGGNGDEIWEG